MANGTGSDSTPQIKAPDRTSYDAIVHQGKTLHDLQNLFKAQFDSTHVPVRRDNDLVAANFPDSSIDLQSPAFIWPESVQRGFHTGTQGPTTIFDSNRFIQSIVDRNKWARLCDAGFLSEEGHPITYLVLSQPASEDVHGGYKLRVWLQGGVHGNEPAGDQSLLALIGKMDNDPAWTARILAKVDIWIIPRYNVDGVDGFRRTCLLGLDLNRDYIKSTAQQSRDFRHLFCKFAPHVAVDMHEFGAAARFEKYVHGSDVMLSAAKNLNIHSGIRQLSEDLFVAEIGRTLEQAGFRWSPYVLGTGNEISFDEAGSAASIGRNAMGLTQCVSILCEVRGIGIADQHFHRRTSSALKCLESVLRTAANNAGHIKTRIQACTHDFVNAQHDIVLRDRPFLASRSFPMIDTETGELTDLPTQFKSTSPLVPTMTRARPEAYLIPASMVDVADRLAGLGLQVQTVTKELLTEVEVFTIVEATFEQTYHEGVVPMNVTTAAATRHVHVPAGTWLVSTGQKNAALALITLEPENMDSYVRLNIIPVIAGQEYPIYRLMASF